MAKFCFVIHNIYLTCKCVHMETWCWGLPRYSPHISSEPSERQRRAAAQQLARIQRRLILWLADTSHGLIQSLGRFRGSITDSEIRTVSLLHASTRTYYRVRGCCRAPDVSEVFALIKVISTINLVRRVWEQYKQQDRSPSLTGRLNKHRHLYLCARHTATWVLISASR